jgi:ribosomal protein S18 acetylase RimI-like enzyme
MIKFEMHNIQLRDGRMVRLRLAQPGDAALFKGYYDGLSAKSRDFMHGWTGLDPVRHGELLALKTRSSDHVAIVVSVATAAEKIIGYCWLDGLVGQPIPMLGIGINDDFHKTELGRILLRTILSLAKQAGISLVRLGVWTDNSRAMHLYRSVGFNDDPRMPTRDFDGRTELYMVAETGYSGPERPRQST